MVRQEEDEVLLQRLEAAAGGRGRSPLYRWMWRHHDRLCEIWKQPDWKAAAAEFAAAGVKAANGAAPNEETTRQTWWKVRRDRKRAGAKAGKLEPVVAAVVVETEAAATDAPPAAEVQEPAVEADDYKPQRGSLRGERKEVG